MPEKGCDEDELASYPAWHNAVAGGAAGAGSRVATAPLDLIRIRRQLTPVVTYPRETLLGSWRKIVQNEGGVTALFRGNTAAVYLWIGYAAVQFSLYNKTKDWISTKDPEGRYPTTRAFVAGANAGLWATLATYPFDVCRTAFAARGLIKETPQQVPFSSLVEPHYNSKGLPSFEARQVGNSSPPRTLAGFASQVYRQKGIRGFYAGAGPAVIQIIPYMGLNFAIYDFLTAGDRRVTLSGYAGSISGAISKIIIYPIDTIKRRLQAQAFYESQQKYKGMLDCMKCIARDEGIANFYRGIVPSVLKTTIATGLSFALFRSTKNLLEGIHDTTYLPADREDTYVRRKPTKQS